MSSCPGVLGRGQIDLDIYGSMVEHLAKVMPCIRNASGTQTVSRGHVLFPSLAAFRETGSDYESSLHSNFVL